MPSDAFNAAPYHRFVAIGECMVEMAPAEAPGLFRKGFAGDTLNTAWYMRQLAPACETHFVTQVGSDPISDEMLAMVQDAGIATDHIARSSDRSVGLYLISLMGGERSFSYWRDSSAARGLADDPALLRDAVADADLVYFSGITMAILPPRSRRTLLDVLEAARADGKTVAFDSNLRPRLWANGDEMRRTTMQAAAVSDIVLPSYDDEAEHFGDADPAATLARYQAVGARTVVVKNGPGDILFAQNGAEGTVSPPVVTDIVDTTAAGDSFNAGIFAGLLAGDPMAEVIRSAAAVAGQVIGQKGALISLDKLKA